MTAVSVFVDDAVLGDLPPLCVISGRPTATSAVIRHRVGGLPAVAFLLVLLGPVGLVLLLILALTWRGETLSLTLPYHDDELRRSRRARLAQGGLVAAGVLAFALSFAFVDVGHGLAWLLVGLLCIVGAAVVGVVARRREVGIDLDASRRWVTLWRVHPDFAESYRSSRRASRESASFGDLSSR